MSMVNLSAEGDQYPPASTTNVTPSSDAVPPPIDASSSSSSPPSSSTPTTTLAPPTNFLTIIHENEIRGVYTIDPSLPKPPGALPCLGDDKKPLNMYIESTSGSEASIDVVVELVRSGDTKGPARLAIKASEYSNNDTTIAVHDRGSNRFRLIVTSKCGSVVIRLPSTFVGAVSTWVKYDQLTFSPDVQARLVTFLDEGREREFFIGDYASSGYENDKSWLGDYLRVEAEKGTVRIEFVDERRGIWSHGKWPSRIKGLFRKLSSR